MVAVPTIQKNEYKKKASKKSDAKDEPTDAESPSEKASEPKGVGGSYVLKDGVRTKKD